MGTGASVARRSVSSPEPSPMIGAVNTRGGATIERRKSYPIPLSRGVNPMMPISCMSRPRGSFSPGDMTMRRLRSRSDACLSKILETDAIYKNVVAFCEEENDKLTQDRINFVIDTRKFSEAKWEDTQEMDRAARQIFDDYIASAQTSAHFIDLDGTDRAALEMGVQYADEHVFDFASEKVAQHIKSDVMPQYLVSNRFEALEHDTKDRVGNVRELEMAVVLQDEYGQKMLQRYFDNENDAFGKQLLDLWRKASTLQLDNPRQVEAFQAKLEEYGGAVWFPSYMKAYMTKTDGGSMMPELVEELKKFLVDLIQDKYHKHFKVSSCYYDFRHNASAQTRLDDVVISLANFRNDRHLNQLENEFKAEMDKLGTFQGMSENEVACSYFRRFLRLDRSEENFLFVVDLLQLKHMLYGELLPQRPVFTRTLSEPDYRSINLPSRCTMSDVHPSAAAMAQEIFNKYLIEGSVMELNVSSAVRDHCTQLYKAGDLHMFDPVQAEVLQLMRTDSFMRFRRHVLFENLKRAQLNKCAMKNLGRFRKMYLEQGGTQGCLSPKGSSLRRLSGGGGQHSPKNHQHHNNTLSTGDNQHPPSTSNNEGNSHIKPSSIPPTTTTSNNNNNNNIDITVKPVPTTLPPPVVLITNNCDGRT